MKPTLPEIAAAESAKTGEPYYIVLGRLRMSSKLSKRAKLQPRGENGRFIPSLPHDYEEALGQ